MRYLLFLLLLALPASALRADEGSDSITAVFVKPMGKSGVNVLLLKEGGRYDYSRYSKTHVYHDFGLFIMRHGKISFESKAKKRSAANLNGKTYFMNKKGLYKKRTDAWFDKKSVLAPSDEEVYRRDWTVNPLTGKTMDELTGKEKTAVAANATISTAARNAQMAAHTKKFYINLAGTYSPLYKIVLEKSYCGPDCYVTSVDKTTVPWNYDTTANVLFSNFETVVHESIHTYNSSIACGGKEGCLIEPGLEITYDRGNIFKSAEFKKYVPAEAPNKIFRYGTYVSDSSIVSANVSGIYGLMDEFSAYHNGVRSCVLAAQSAMQKGDTAKAAQFISQASGTYFAYYEFNLFMAWYLKAAKNDHAGIYNEMMANTNLRVAYTLLDAGFAETIDNLRRTSAIIEKKNGNDPLAYNEKAYAAYPKQLLAKEKGTLDAFRVKGVTKGNYFTFLK
jgi:hypothetical protein